MLSQMIPNWLNISHSLGVITQALSLLKCFSSLLSHSRPLLALSWPTELIYYIIVPNFFHLPLQTHSLCESLPGILLREAHCIKISIAFLVGFSLGWVLVEGEKWEQSQRIYSSISLPVKFFCAGSWILDNFTRGFF